MLVDSPSRIESPLRQLERERACQRHREQRASVGGRPISRRHGLPARRAPARVLARAPDLVQDAARVVEQQLTGLGRRGAAPAAQQQVLAQLDFGAGAPAGQRGLGDAQVL